MRYPLLKWAAFSAALSISAIASAKTTISGDSNALTITTDIENVKFVTIRNRADFTLRSNDLHIVPTAPLADGSYEAKIFASKGLKKLSDDNSNGRDPQSLPMGEVIKAVKTKRFNIVDGQVTKLKNKEQ
jgi:hypothetical protein